MRIISGRLGGRQFEAPKTHRTHPMSDKVRGGLFNALGDISGLTVLDAFAGSGALSFEALSRGAKFVTAVDVDKNAHQSVVKNSRALGLDEQIKAVRANVGGWSDNNPTDTFDLVFAAPPYDDLRPDLLQKLVKHVAGGGLYVLDWPGDMKAPVFQGLSQVKQKNYGDARLVFYRKVA